MTVAEIITELRKHHVVPRLADGRLRLAGDTGNLSPAFIQELKLQKDAIISFLAKEEDLSLSHPMPRTSPASHYPVSNAQRDIYLACRRTGGNPAYNIVIAFRIRRALDPIYIQRSFDAAISRHESLRSVFRIIDGELRQVVGASSSFKMEVSDTGAMSDAKAYFRDCMHRFTHHEFDLEQGPLLQAALLLDGAGEDTPILILCIHHLVSDGWSVRILMEEILEDHDLLAKGKMPAAAHDRLQYRDYVQWMLTRRQEAAHLRAAHFWRSAFSTVPDPLILPGDHSRPVNRSFKGGLADEVLPRSIFHSIQECCREQHVTLFNFLHTALVILLSKLSEEKDIVIGTPAAGRIHVDLYDQVGLFANILPLRTAIGAGASFRSVLRDVSEHTALALSHQEYPFDDLLSGLRLDRDPSRHPLFDVMIVLQDTAGSGKTFSPLPAGGRMDGYSKFDLCWNFMAGEDGNLHADIEYAADIFSESNIRRWWSFYLYIIEQALEDPLMAVRDIQLATPHERSLVLSAFNPANSSPLPDLTLTTLFRQQVLRTPEDIALICDDRCLTYAELNILSNQLAQYIQEKYAVGTGDLTGILLPRDEWLVIGMLAILKSGAAYVPLDLSYPAERTSYILSDSACKFVLDSQVLQAFASDGHQWSSEDPTECVQPGDLAYVIYTSGSTGRPKGVMIEHRNACSFIGWCRDEFDRSRFDVVYAATSICFDLSVFEILYPLCSGKKIRLLSSALSIPQYLGKDTGILLNTVPSVVGALLDAGTDLSAVHVLNMAGEPVPTAYVNALDCSHTEVRNLYGPTEYTTYSTVYKMDKEHPVLIGRPIADTRIYILDADNNVQPIGVPGEICIGGRGLARGYLNRPELTAEKFTADPFFKAGRMYRTGDHGCWLPDGNLAFVGRKDNQVKVRGYRIEPGEIERVLEEHPAVETAVVIAVKSGDGSNKLIAYIKMKDDTDVRAIREHAAHLLPAYMLPASFTVVASFPLTPNGKIDRAQLPRPVEESRDVRVPDVPRNETEARLIGIWARLLSDDNIEPGDNFFHLGGTSLSVLRLVNFIFREFDVQLPLAQLFQTPVLRDQARLITSAVKSVYRPIPAAPRQPCYPMSPSQRRLWALSQFVESSAAYHMSGVFTLSGRVDREALDRSFSYLIDRHEILRTVFREDAAGEMKQFILSAEEISFRINHIDASNDGEKALHHLINERSSSPFDLSAGPLIRVDLFRKDEDTWVLCCVIHHISFDGWSMEVLIRELAVAYNAFKEGMAPPLQPLPIQYKDYTNWQLEQLRGPWMASTEKYWLERLSGELPVPELPPGHKRPPVKTYKGAALSLYLRQDKVEALKNICVEKGGSLLMGCTAIVNILLQRYTGLKDIIIGTPVAGREHPSLEEQIGLYVNTLALRIRTSPEESFRHQLQEVIDICLTAYERQDYPFDELISRLSLPADMSRNALFEVWVAWQDSIGDLFKDNALDGLQISPYGVDIPRSSKFDISFLFSGSAAGTKLTIEYNPDIFEEHIVSRMMGHFECLLNMVISHPDMAAGRLDILSDAEKHRLLTTFNDTAVPFPSNNTVADLFERQVDLTPGRTALAAAGGTMTYSELNGHANRVADLLRRRYDIGRNDLVGIQLDRGPWLVICMLGILKSGAGYLPLDTAYPEDRLSYMINDSGCKLVIDDGVLAEFLQAQDLYSPKDLTRTASPLDLMYVIYTSGSTGRPKGARIHQRSFVNLIVWYAGLLDLTRDDVVALMAPVSFDLAQKNIFTPLITGACLSIPPALYGDYSLLAEVVEKHGVTVINAAPSAFYPLLDPSVNDGFKKIDSLKKVVLGGEPIHLQEFDKWRASKHFHAVLINSYGPTECTDVVSFYTLHPDEWDKIERLPIGRPVDNCRLYILDEEQLLTPEAMKGEIYVGGICVGEGYINNPELTAQRFLPDPFEEGKYMYKTGDVGRWQPDGCIDFMGRKDEQVKIRGHRIEPGEIEKVLQSYPGVTMAAVVVSTDGQGERKLVAWMAAKGQLDIPAVAVYAARQLPAFMIPSAFMQLDNMPLTPSGKIDRQQLSARQPVLSEMVCRPAPPRNEIEEALIFIWQEILGRQDIGVNDNFFALGGHSLKLSRLVTRIHHKFNVKIAFRDLFANPVLEQQAQVIAGTTEEPVTLIPSAPAMDSYPLTPAQQQLWLLCQFPGASSAYNIAGIFEFDGAFDPDVMQQAFRILIARHESLRTAFRSNAEGVIRQYILPIGSREFHLLCIDAYAGGGHSMDKENMVNDECAMPFDLAGGQLVRVRAFRTAVNTWTITLVIHHIIGDGWSMGILLKELSTLYNALKEGVAIELPSLRIQYKDYTLWHAARLEEADMEKIRQYWLRHLEGELPVLQLPGDKKRPLIKSYRGGTLYKVLDIPLSSSFNTFCRQQQVTLFMGLLALVDVLLYRYTGEEDIIVGSPVAGRDHPELSGQVGLYMNTLALRSRFSGDNSFIDLLNHVRTVVLDGYEYQEQPFNQLVEALHPRRDPARNALFDVMVVLENADTVRLDQQVWKDMTCRPIAHTGSISGKFDLLFTFRESEEGLTLALEYNSDLFEAGMPARMADNLEMLLSSVIQYPDLPVAVLDIIGEEERRQLLVQFNENGCYYPESTINDLFFAQAVKKAGATALVVGDRTFTYKELEEYSAKLANYLRTEYDVKKGDIAAVRLPRNEWLVISLLGVLRSGGAYVPIDPEYPAERQEHTILDSGCRCIIDDTFIEKFIAVQAGISASLVQVNTPDDLAYIIYTSGSTGKPKGVMISHRNLHAFLHWCAREFDTEVYDVVFGGTSVCFDLSVFEIFFTLASGKKLRLLPNALAIPEYLQKDNNILLNTVPGMIRALLKGKTDLSRVRVLNMAGETVPDEFTQELDCRRMEVRNLYGPTEDTTYSTCYRLKKGQPVLIGRPIDNTQVYIFDTKGQPVPIGVYGEICLGGDGLSPGYWKMPEMTAEKFFAHPYRPGQKLYRTGDTGRWLASGEIQLAGRNDHQVKIRGYRIELQEIEYILRTIDGVDSAVVQVCEDGEGDKQLAAYLQGPQLPDMLEIRRTLRMKLPSWTIPAYFIRMDELPLTPNGKVDRKKLPAPSGQTPAGSSYASPSTPTENRLVSMWQELLPLQQIGIRDNFFDLGGHSLKAAQLLLRINREFSVQLDMQHIFAEPTVESIGAHIDFILHQQLQKKDRGNLVAIDLN